MKNTKKNPKPTAKQYAEHVIKNNLALGMNPEQILADPGAAAKRSLDHELGTIEKAGRQILAFVRANGVGAFEKVVWKKNPKTGEKWAEKTNVVPTGIQLAQIPQSQHGEINLGNNDQ